MPNCTPTPHSSEKYCSNEPQLIVREKIPVVVVDIDCSSITMGLSIVRRQKPVEN
jgi:hypothetical protein